jgi:hypothetical protein
MAAGRGDVRKIVDDLTRAQDNGKLGADKAVLISFLKDLARNVNAASSRGNRQVLIVVLYPNSVLQHLQLLSI